MTSDVTQRLTADAIAFVVVVEAETAETATGGVGVCAHITLATRAIEWYRSH